MASKKSKTAPTDEELLAQFEDLGTEGPAPKLTKTSTSKASGKHTSATAQSEQDLLAELGNLATQRPSSRPSTPSLKSTTAAGTGARSPKRSAIPTPTPGGRPSEERSASGAQPRKSGESTRSFHQSFTPATTEESPEPESKPAPAASIGGGWWGGLLSTATAAVSQAQAAVKEIQKNEEAQRWAEQMKGNVGALKGLGGDLRSLALPTFQNILQTIAPPISSHERLQIHITHDLSGYPTLDPLIYSVFSRVMSQVEGGDLMVVQKGKEASPRRESEHGISGKPVGGWNDGPWWRSTDKRSINAVRGVVEGSKLARASAESYSAEHFASRGGVEEAAKQATETLSESNPTRNSDIFLAIQAINQPVPKDLFAAGPPSEEGSSAVQEAEETKSTDEIIFAIYLHDPIHGIVFHALSQCVPGQWIDWLDASSPADGVLPESIAEIIESGGVDPREWVAEWIEETLSLAVGIVAQRYVARRMGVGEGGVRKGKMKADKGAGETLEGGGGEAARAIGGM
ncbi:hypothetical protein EPUS_00170 [Endocarpon pusillum Z07020]|uniref:Maintenance of telomere capping protein 1 n=1 Tax=Endocarpon pusillum (strain Z07020 / HMAS-L-300199) TaxID=1263415 RepID=U1GCR3_ENDPU|nr:uncharacterized protein EPUS_00170 [Endocarpon pusillum Z07020]ERF75377.1 hypothetical protein EPUS_00170 [Endocarpon pusillum Z07020]